MIEIKDLLAKFQSILLSEEAKIEGIQGILFQVLGILIPLENIKIKNNIIYLNIKSIYKNEIFLKKEKITSLLEERFGERAPSVK